MREAVIPADVGAWIHDVVLPAGYRASEGPLLTMCSCQFGPSGTCLHDKHEKCVRTQGWHRHGEPDPETHISVREGGAWVVAAAWAAVWRVGTPCRWLCPCECHTTVQALIPPVPATPPRLSRTGGNGRIVADHLSIWDEPAPTLFDLETTR